MLHVGIDLHKKYSYIVALDDEGNIVDQCRLTNKEVAGHIVELGSEVQVTFEATCNWQQLYELNNLKDKYERSFWPIPRRSKP